MPKQTFFNLPDDKRQRVLDAAIDEFAENDYQAASITRIAEKAEIAKGSFYQYFEDKADLYMHLLEIAAERKKEIIAATPPPDPDMNVFDYLRWLVREVINYEVWMNPRLAKAVERSVYSTAPFRDQLVRLNRGAVWSFYGDLLRRGIARGELDPDLDINMACQIFYSVGLELWDYMRTKLNIPPDAIDILDYAKAHADDFEAIFDSLFHILEYGMKRGPFAPEKAVEDPSSLGVSK
jgi:AcrR family transcriptional regulator